MGSGVGEWGFEVAAGKIWNEQVRPWFRWVPASEGALKRAPTGA